MGSFGASAESVRNLLGGVQHAYNQHRFIDAYRESLSLWTPSTDTSQLSVEELVLGGRLAARLGGSRLSRKLLMAARQREPRKPLVRYFTQHLRVRGYHFFDELRAIEALPDLGGDDPELRASWFGYYGRVWAGLRDFARALDCIRRAHDLDADKGWVLSCESEVFGAMDRWQDALRCAEQAWVVSGGAPYAADSMATALLNLGRVEESARRMAEAADHSQSCEIVQIACWHQCALAETLEGGERLAALQRASALAARFPEVAPLADRESRAQFARAHLDIADLADDHEAIKHWSRDVRSHFYRQVLANLQKNPEGVRIRLPFRRAIQRHAECVPTSIASALAANGVTISIEKLASEVTFGGTAEWAAADWLRERGLHVRFFAVTPELACRLIKSRIAFVAVWDDDESGHAVAVVGLDEAAGTVIVHDPQSFRSTQYLLSTFRPDYSPLGMKGMAVVPAEKANELDDILPADADVVDRAQAHQRALTLQGPSAARAIVAEVAERYPEHPGTRYMRAVQAVEDGRTGEALRHLRGLLRQFPSSAMVRYRLLNACRALGNTALLRETLRTVVETGSVPGAQSQQEWVQPHPRYVYEYADLLRLSSATRDRAKSLLNSLIDKRRTSAGAWHNLGDLFWVIQDREAALLAFRIASALSDNDEHYARAYSDTLCRCARKEEAFAWLENRVRTYASSTYAVSTWVTWISALEDWGEPEKALATCSAALEKHGSVPGLLVFVIPFLARMGDWTAADRELSKLEHSGSPSFFHEAAVYYYRMKGEVAEALRHAESWLAELPRSVPARFALLDLIDKTAGSDAAAQRSADWIRDLPGNEDIEEAFCQHVGSSDHFYWKKLRVLMRRVKRNRDDGWAWREFVFAALNEYEFASDQRRRRMHRRIESLLAECERTSAEDAATLRAQGLWLENKGDWAGAVPTYLEAIRREPENFYAYRRLWECSSRLPEDERRRIWEEIEPLFLRSAGHLPNARDMATLLAERFGVREAETSVAGWLKQRPDDPNVVEASVDLLLEHGHGHSDAERALAMLKPAVERFPYHAGLRFSLANAYRGVGDHATASNVFRELVKRHPDNTSALMQLAWVQDQEGELAAALNTLDAAGSREPQNPNVLDARAQILIQNNRLDEASATLEKGVKRLPKSVRMRERAIAQFMQCGRYEQAVAVARHGVAIYHRGAYMWLLLGRALADMPQFAEQGEIEACLRKSLELNCSLFDTADLLARVLVDQRRYDAAAQVMRDVETRMSDPSPARGRLAWIKRQQGLKREALEDLAQTLTAAPWYAWGWNLLTDWLQEDEPSAKSRELLDAVPPQMLTNVAFRLERLVVLAKAGVDSGTIDEEWKALLADFPENVPLHLRRYDSLQESDRLGAAAAVLEKILPVASDNPYMLARLVDLRCRQGVGEEALEAALRVCFAPVEENAWPAHNVWEVLEAHNSGSELSKRMQPRLNAGEKPTPRALSLYVSFAMKQYEQQRKKQPLRRTWFPGRGAREALNVLHTIDTCPWGDDFYRAEVFSILCDYGYHRLVIRTFKTISARGQELNTDAWAQVGRALIDAGNKRAARKFLSGWRERTGIAMWIVANYTLCFSRLRKAHLREIVSTCQDALAGLPHDHCARYLAHMQAEACALLGDKQGLLATWEGNAGYFDGDMREGEYFKTEDAHLLGDIPMLVRFIQQKQNWLYREAIWGIRFKRLWNSHDPKGDGENKWLQLIGWIVFILVWVAIKAFLGSD